MSDQAADLPEVEADLIAVVTELALVEAGEIDASSPLFSTRLLDSFGFLHLLDHVEQNYGVATTPAEMTTERWDTIALIAAYIRTARIK